ncbi:MAG: LicD family protein [Selenomonadaceae bacterium]|nr:LicD family protein [Selenomonadaceae bacterium]
MDFGMMRPEYNRFVDVLDAELDGERFEIKHKTFAVTKIAHKQTTMIYSLDDSAINLPQGILIDVCALDIAPDGTQNSQLAFNAIQEILTVVFSEPATLRELEHLQHGERLVVELEVLEKIAAMPFDERVKELFRYVDALSGQSSAVGFFQDVLDGFYKSPMCKNFFDETIYLPFETIELPAPKKFDEVLTACYKNWRVPVRDGKQRSGIFHSADIPWRDFFRSIKFNPQIKS